MKQSVLVLWVAVIAGSVLASGILATISQVVFALLFVAHLAEFFVKKEVLTKAGGSMGNHFVQTLIYGMFHWQPLEDAQNGNDTSS
jgi:uncharacterized protein YhhL (DUF1145 family)